VTLDRPPFPDFPGAVGLTSLQAYEWETADGEHGGSPHLHLVCSEAYVVTGGTGRLQTLTADGPDEVPLGPGDVVWFEPGTIHRIVNDGELEVVVVMQNGGLPEAGDAVLTFPAEHLRDRASYDAAASLAGPDGLPSAERARARRDLALLGYAALRQSWEAGDKDALFAFHQAAAELVAPLLDRWSSVVIDGAQARAAEALERVAALRAGDHLHLRDARVARIGVPAERTFGMCGRLHAYDAIRRD
jgi:mannose-6-phosphate isomerase-like protein (cupin superfamily)